MLGKGAGLGRAVVAVFTIVSALALSVTLFTDEAAAKKKGKPKPDAFEQLKAQATFGAGEQSKQSGNKSQGNSDSNDDDKPGKQADKGGKDSVDTPSDNRDDGKDGSSRSAKRDSDGGGTGRAAAREQRDKGEPPKTVEEWLKGLTAPHEPAAVPATAAQSVPAGPKGIAVPTAVPKATAVQTAQPVPKPGAPRPSNRTVRDRPLELDAIRPEVLAKNISDQTRELAIQKGFTDLGDTHLSQLNTKYTKLGAPAGMSASDAFELLRQLAPDQKGGPNTAYRIYKTATATASHTKPEPAAVPPPAPMATTCGTDRCFGQTLIGWRPQLQSCTKNLRIGVVDTGVDRNHPALKSRRIEARQEPKLRALLRRPAAPTWHGTGVLALMAGEPFSDTPGLIPDAHFFVADVFYADGDGLPVSDTASILEALNWLASRHVNIVNMSLTGPHDELLKAAIADLSRKGIIFVAAVGNDGPGAPPTYPSAYPQVVAVSAINKDYGSYRYANQGDHVDLATPGVDIWTAMPEAQAAYHSGTSFAVPYATAMLASVFNGLQAKTKAEALGKLSYIDLGLPGRDPVFGRGLAVAPYGCEMGPGAPPKLAPQPGSVAVTSVKN